MMCQVASRPTIDQSSQPESDGSDVWIPESYRIIVGVDEPADNLSGGSNRCQASHEVGVEQSRLDHIRSFGSKDLTQGHQSPDKSRRIQDSHIESLALKISLHSLFPSPKTHNDWCNLETTELRQLLGKVPLGTSRAQAIDYKQDLEVRDGLFLQISTDLFWVFVENSAGPPVETQ